MRLLARVPVRFTPTRVVAAGLTGLLGVLAACGSGATVAIDRPVAPQEEAVTLTLEEAALLARGGLIEIYGLDADPVPVRVDRTEDTLDGQTVWRLDLVVEVDLDGGRAERRWRMWVGTPAEGDPGVLRAEQR